MLQEKTYEDGLLGAKRELKLVPSRAQVRWTASERREPYVPETRSERKTVNTNAAKYAVVCQARLCEPLLMVDTTTVSCMRVNQPRDPHVGRVSLADRCHRDMRAMTA